MSCSLRQKFFIVCGFRWSTRAAWVTWPAAACHVSASWAACGRAGVRPPASLWTADPRRSFSTAASSSPAVGPPTAPRFATLAARITTFQAIKYAGKDNRDGNNVKNERTNIPVSNETKTFWYRSRIYLVENRLFRFGPESALMDQIEMISFDGADSGTNLDVFGFIPVRCRNVWWTMVERLFLYCFDSTTYAYRGKAHR